MQHLSRRAVDQHHFAGGGVFDQVPEAHRFEGHGPHRLVLGTPVQHTWQGPEKGKLRISDHWRFTLPAAAESIE